MPGRLDRLVQNQLSRQFEFYRVFEEQARIEFLATSFIRMMALSRRCYMFTRTNRKMHLMMTDAPAGSPDFGSANANDWAARMEIAEQVCRHGLGEYQVITDDQFYRERAVQAA